MRIKATFDNGCQAPNVFPSKIGKRLSAGLHPHAGMRLPSGGSSAPEKTLTSVAPVMYTRRNVCLRLIVEFPDLQQVAFVITMEATGSLQRSARRAARQPFHREGSGPETLAEQGSYVAVEKIF
jgi:hypothetical protein